MKPTVVALRMDDMIEDLDRAVALLERIDHKLTKPATPPTNASASTLNVNAGGAGAWAAAWIATMCCTACLVAMVLGGMWMLHQAKQIDDLNAYLQAIYQQAPSLQPKEASK